MPGAQVLVTKDYLVQPSEHGVKNPVGSLVLVGPALERALEGVADRGR